MAAAMHRRAKEPPGRCLSNDGKQRAVVDRVLKIYCDTNRVCELEDSVVEWYNSKYF